jgi:hypothetical protein
MNFFTHCLRGPLPFEECERRSFEQHILWGKQQSYLEIKRYCSLPAAMNFHFNFKEDSWLNRIKRRRNLVFQVYFKTKWLFRILRPKSINFLFAETLNALFVIISSFCSLKYCFFFIQMVKLLIKLNFLDKSLMMLAYGRPD